MCSHTARGTTNSSRYLNKLSCGFENTTSSSIQRSQSSGFGAATVHYLGYNISGKGIRPGEKKMKAIEAFPTPDTPKKMREFVGLVNYLVHSNCSEF